MISFQKASLAIIAGSLTLSIAFPAFAESFEQARPEQARFNHGPQLAYDGQQNLTPEQRKQRREARRQEMKKALGLSEEQSAKLDAIREKNRGQARAMREQLENKRKALADYMGSENSDPQKAKQMQQDITQTESNLSDLRMNTWFEMRKNLTPDQIKKMQDFHKKHGGPGCANKGGKGGPKSHGPKS